MNRALGLPSRGDDLVYQTNRSTLNAPMAILSLCNFGVKQGNRFVIIAAAGNQIGSRFFDAFQELAELRSGTPSRISMGRTGSEYLHNLEKLLFRRDRAVLYKFGSVVIRRRKTAGGVPVLILKSVGLNLQSCQWADSGKKGEKS